jgi:hypothetical protein
VQNNIILKQLILISFFAPFFLFCMDNLPNEIPPKNVLSKLALPKEIQKMVAQKMVQNVYFPVNQEIDIEKNI